MNIVMDASHDQMDRVDRARLVESQLESGPCKAG